MFFYLFTSSTFSQNKTISAYVFLAEECPISIYMAKPLREVIEKHSHHVNLLAVFPNAKSTELTAKKFIDDYQLDGFEFILDKDLSLVKKWGATITPEVVIVDQDNKIIYRGRISNAYSAPGRMNHKQRINDFYATLNNYFSEKPVNPDWPTAVGCYITMK